MNCSEIHFSKEAIRDRKLLPIFKNLKAEQILDGNDLQSARQNAHKLHNFRKTNHICVKNKSLLPHCVGQDQVERRFRTPYSASRGIRLLQQFSEIVQTLGSHVEVRHL